MKKPPPFCANCVEEKPLQPVLWLNGKVVYLCSGCRGGRALIEVVSGPSSQTLTRPAQSRLN